jgi:hypothetical protein
MARDDIELRFSLHPPHGTPSAASRTKPTTERP